MKDLFAKFKNGQLVTFKLPITGINTSLTEGGRLGIEVIPHGVASKRGYHSYSPKHLKRIAKKAGATGYHNLESAISQSLEDSFLVVTGHVCKKDGLMKNWDEDGQPEYVDEETGRKTYESSWFRIITLETTIELAADAKEYIAGLKFKLDLEDAREERKSQDAAIRKLSTRDRANQQNVYTDAEISDDEDVDEDEDLAEGLFEEVDEPVETAKEKAARIKKEKKARGNK
jgi:hypothetical protein